MGEIEEIREEKRARSGSTSTPSSEPSRTVNEYGLPDPNVAQPEKETFWQRVKKPGSVWQIIFAALLAIALGLIIKSQVGTVHPAAIALTAIPGVLWLRALRAVVLPMIVTAMIMAIQRLRAMTQGGGKAGKLGLWTIGYYVVTTLIAVAHSTLLVALVWSKLMQPVSGDQLAVDDSDLQETIKEREDIAIHEVVVDMFNSLVPQNVVNALATDSLLAVLITSVVLGFVLKPGGALMRAVEEVEIVITRIITWLIKVAPIGVFFLIMPNLFRLDIAEIGRNLGILIGGTLCGMFIHLFIIIPIIFFAITRKNPYTMWMKCSPAWITAWGTASSAATLPVTIRCVLERGVPVTVTGNEVHGTECLVALEVKASRSLSAACAQGLKFAVPLGCLINMDGTAIYFPIVVVFLAATQGITLDAAQYIIVILLSTMASIGTTPIPSSSLVLVVMIAGSIDVPITGMYAVVVAIDWFLDRFRTAVNVSCDTFAAIIVTKITGIKDEDDQPQYTEELNSSPDSLREASTRGEEKA